MPHCLRTTWTDCPYPGQVNFNRSRRISNLRLRGYTQLRTPTRLVNTSRLFWELSHVFGIPEGSPGRHEVRRRAVARASKSDDASSFAPKPLASPTVPRQVLRRPLH